MTFNSEGIINFLERCFREERREESKDSAFRAKTVLHICAYHALRRVRCYVAKHAKSKAASKLAVNAFRALLRTDTLDAARDIVVLMATVFTQKHNSEAVKTAREELQQKQEKFLKECSLRTEDDPDEELNELDVSAFGHVALMCARGVVTCNFFPRKFVIYELI